MVYSNVLRVVAKLVSIKENSKVSLVYTKPCTDFMAPYKSKCYIKIVEDCNLKVVNEPTSYSREYMYDTK